MIATDLQLGFLTEIDVVNVEVLRHDIRTGTFPPGLFDLIHTRAVLTHISPGVDLLRRIVTWLAPGGWLVLEEPDFGMWIGDADPVWATAPVDPGRLPELGPVPGPVSAAFEPPAASHAEHGDAGHPGRRTDFANERSLRGGIA